jgi:uncharacterized membrane protein YdbT with pleckstrin-like domain
MSYIEKILAPDEVLIAKARFHWLYYLLAYGTLALCLALGGYMYSQAWGPWWAAAVAAVGPIVFLRVMVPIWTTEIGVTSERVILKQGFLNRHTDEIELPSIEEINVDQGFLGRLLGFGRITIRGTGVDDVDIPAIADPLPFSRSVQHGLEKMRPSAISPRSQPNASKGTSRLSLAGRNPAHQALLTALRDR